GTNPKRRWRIGDRATAVAMVLMAALVFGTGQGQSQPSIALGKLRAVPSSGSALVFQLPVISQGRGLINMPTVVVRRPRNVLFFVANNTIELRLLELADVELEVNHAGQTINRLLVKAELQAAHARMLSGLKRNRDQSVETAGNKGTEP